MTPGIDMPLVMVGEFDISAFDVPDSIASANPKSSTLTPPFGETLMLAGFKSRWTTPFS